MIYFGIDASSANKARRTGVERHAFEVIQAMKKISLRDDERVVLFSPTTLLAELSEMPEGWESRVLRSPLARGWMSLRVSWEMLRRPTNILFVPGQGLPFSCPFSLQRGGGRWKAVTTIHDIGWRRFPALYLPFTRRRLEATTRRAVRRAAKIFVVSEWTKAEVTAVYGIAQERLVVTPNAVNSSVYRTLDRGTIDAVLDHYRIGRNYFLFVGRLESKKNVDTIVRAFAQFKKSRGLGDPWQLVLIGVPGFGYQSDWSNRPAVFALGALPDTEVAAFMNGAAALLAPAWYEGFGLTPLEALSCGTPAIVSDIPAHREVCGASALYASPADIASWVWQMNFIASDNGIRLRLVETGKARAASYAWQVAAETIMQTMRSLV